MSRKPFKIINSKGKAILGVVDSPNYECSVISKRCKICIICNGLNGNRIEANRMLVKLVNILSICGVTSIRFDYTGMGVSEGNFWETSLSTKVDDLYDLTQSICDRCQEKEIEWIFIGYSDGIAVVLNLLKKYVFTNYRIISWSPILFPVQSELKERIRFVREPFSKELVIPFAGLWMGKQYMKDVSSTCNMYEEYLIHKNVSCTIFGTEDNKTKITQEKMKDVNDMEIFYVQGGDHVFSSETQMQQVIEKTCSWISNYNN